MKGAQTTQAAFQRLFDNFGELNREKLNVAEKDKMNPDAFSILMRVEKLRSDVANKFNCLRQARRP